MLELKNVNVNPKGRKTGDCVTRAIASALNISWEEAIQEQVKVALKTKYSLASKQTYEKILTEWGFVKMKQPRKVNNTKYYVKELDKVLTPKQMKSGVVVSVANHLTFVKDGYIIDTWNCGLKSVGNYYVRED